MNECDRVWTWVGEAVLASGPSSSGEETEIARVGRVALLGGEDEGDSDPTVGNGCLPFITLGCEIGLEGEAALALLPDRLRYSTIRSWKDGLVGVKLDGDILLKSSADFDHPRREMLRRSPNPPLPH